MVILYLPVWPLIWSIFTTLFRTATTRDHHSHPAWVHTNQDQVAIKSPQQKRLEYWNAHSRTRLESSRNKKGPTAPTHANANFYDVPPCPIHGQHRSFLSKKSRHNCLQISLSSCDEKVEENLQPIQIGDWCMRSMAKISA